MKIQIIGDEIFADNEKVATLNTQLKDSSRLDSFKDWIEYCASRRY